MVTSSSTDAIFKAIADPTRRQILGFLKSGRPTVGELASNFRVSRPAISKHIRQLHRAGLIVVQKRGASRVCALNAEPLREVGRWIDDYQVFWSEQLKNLKRFVETENE